MFRVTKCLKERKSSWGRRNKVVRWKRNKGLTWGWGQATNSLVCWKPTNSNVMRWRGAWQKDIPEESENCCSPNLMEEMSFVGSIHVLRHSFSELYRRNPRRSLDRKTRKYLTMHDALHLRDRVAWLHLPRKTFLIDRGLGDQAMIGLTCYVAKSNEKLLTAAWSGMSSNQDSCKAFQWRRCEKRLKEVKEEKLISWPV